MKREMLKLLYLKNAHNKSILTKLTMKKPHKKLPEKLNSIIL